MFTRRSISEALTGLCQPHQTLAEQVEELAAINKDLKDKNEELVLQMKPADGW